MNSGSNQNNQNNQNNSNIQTPQKPSQNESSYQSFATEVLNLVNKEREKAGVGHLTLDTNLSSAATIRGNEILKSFSHTRPDGRSFYTVLSDNGITYRGAAFCNQKRALVGRKDQIRRGSIYQRARRQRQDFGNKAS